MFRTLEKYFQNWGFKVRKGKEELNANRNDEYKQTQQSFD